MGHARREKEPEIRPKTDILSQPTPWVTYTTLYDGIVSVLARLPPPSPPDVASAARALLWHATAAGSLRWLLSAVHS